MQENTGSVNSLSTTVSTVRLGGSLAKSKDSGHYGSVKSSQESATPPPLPPRFATIRKSYTLPHNMAAAAAGTSETRIYDNPVRLRQLIRPRPSSLSVEKRQFLRSASQDNANDRSGNREVFTLKRSLKVFLRSNETDLFENINSVVSRNVINRTSQLGQFCELCSSILRKERLYLS